MNKSLRIGIFTDDFFPASGGITRSIQAQIDEFHNLGHEVILFVPKYQLQKPTDAKTVVVPAYIPHPKAPAHFCVMHFGTMLAKALSSKYPLDIIHSTTERGALILAAHMSRIQRIPHVHTFHINISGSHKLEPLAPLRTFAYSSLIAPFLSLSSKKKAAFKSTRPGYAKIAESANARIDWKSLAQIASHVDAFTTPSYFMMNNILAASRGISTHAVIPNGYSSGMQNALREASREDRGDCAVRFISVSRLAKEKRVDVIIDAFIEADLPKSELVILGGGHELKSLQKRADGYDNIIFKGQVADQKIIASELKNADVFVLASYRFDNQPVVVTEAAAAGLPVLYCDDQLDVGLTPKNSLLVPESIQGLAKGMRKIAQPDILQNLRSGTDKIADDLTAAKMAKRYLTLYRSLL